MKKTFTMLMIVMIALLSSSVRAQIANPYLDSTSTWYEVRGSGGIVITSEHNKYYIDGDTIISANSYYKVYWDQIDSVWNSWNGNLISANNYNHIYQGGLREDSLKRFYIFYPNQATESLLFDFNLSVGDSLPNMIANYGCNNPPITVTAIDTAYLGSQALKKIHVSPGIIDKTLYEGISSSAGFLYSGTLCQFFESGGCLVAYKKGLDSLYINCGLETTGISESINKNLVSVYPNPNAGVFTISYSRVFTNGEINIYNLVGDKIYSDKISGNTKKEIHLDNISSGIYFVKVSDGGKTYCKKLIIQQD